MFAGSLSGKETLNSGLEAETKELHFASGPSEHLDPGSDPTMTENLKKQPKRGILKQSTSFEQRELEPPQ